MEDSVAAAHRDASHAEVRSEHACGRIRAPVWIIDIDEASAAVNDEIQSEEMERIVEDGRVELQRERATGAD